MGHQVIKLQNPLKTLGFLQFYRFKTVKDRIIADLVLKINCLFPVIKTDFFGAETQKGGRTYLCPAPFYYGTASTPTTTIPSTFFFQAPSCSSSCSI